MRVMVTVRIYEFPWKKNYNSIIYTSSADEYYHFNTKITTCHAKHQSIFKTCVFSLVVSQAKFYKDTSIKYNWSLSSPSAVTQCRFNTKTCLKDI